MGKRLTVVGDTLKESYPKSTLVYNGVDFKRFKDLGKKREYLGWIERDYDLIDLEGIKRLAKENKLPIKIAKDIPYEEMNKFYNKCKLFVSLPPSYTGFNMAWLEAIAAGVPELMINEYGIGKRLKKNQDISKFTWKNAADKLEKLWK